MVVPTIDTDNNRTQTPPLSFTSGANSIIGTITPKVAMKLYICRPYILDSSRRNAEIPAITLMIVILNIAVSVTIKKSIVAKPNTTR